MPTRRSDHERPQERYLSDPAYVERRGLLANAVAAKADLYSSSKDRSILFFLQAISMRNGGMLSVAEEFLSVVPPDCLKIDLLPEQSAAERLAGYLASGGSSGGSLKVDAVSAIAGFLESLCLDPSLDVSRIRKERAFAEAPFLKDPIRSVELFREKRSKLFAVSKATTSIGEVIRETLDYARSTGRMAIVEGASGSGKTVGAETWSHEKAGEAVFLTLSGITHRTGFFQRLAATLGLAKCQQASSKIQARVEGYLARTRTMLVIDEAHFLWPQHQRSRSAPELVDWVDTALVNNGVPVAMLCTDQFPKLKARCEKETGWNSDQLMHRVGRYVRLPDRPTKEDLFLVARNLLSHVWSDTKEAWVFDSSTDPDTRAVKIAALYGSGNLLPLGSVRSIIDSARDLAHRAGRPKVKLYDVVQAQEAQGQTDSAIRAAFAAPRPSGPRSRCPDRYDAPQTDVQLPGRPRINEVAPIQPSRLPALT